MLISLDEVKNIDIKGLNSKVLNLCKCIDRYWKIVHRNKSKYLNKYCDWLNVIEWVDFIRSDEQLIQENADENCLSDQNVEDWHNNLKLTIL